MPTYIRGYTLGSIRTKKHPDTGESGETYEIETFSERSRRLARNDIHYRTLILDRALSKVQAVAWSEAEKLVIRLIVNRRQSARTLLKAIELEVEARFKTSELGSYRGIKEIVQYVEEKRNAARN